MRVSFLHGYPAWMRTRLGIDAVEVRFVCRTPLHPPPLPEAWFVCRRLVQASPSRPVPEAWAEAVKVNDAAAATGEAVCFRPLSPTHTRKTCRAWQERLSASDRRGRGGQRRARAGLRRRNEGSVWSPSARESIGLVSRDGTLIRAP